MNKYEIAESEKVNNPLDRKYSLVPVNGPERFQLFISDKFFDEKFTDDGAEILGEWHCINSDYVLKLYCNLNSKGRQHSTVLMYTRLQLIIGEAIKYILSSDRKFIETISTLKKARIEVAYKYREGNYLLESEGYVENYL